MSVLYHLNSQWRNFPLQTAVDADSDDLETPLGDWKKLGLSHQFKWTKNPIACFSSWLTQTCSPSYTKTLRMT